MPDLFITLHMPEDGHTTLVMRRGDLAVTYTYLGGVPGMAHDRHALAAAYRQLQDLESHPPLLTDLPSVPTVPSTKSAKPTKSTKPATSEPTLVIPLHKGTRTLPISRLKLTGGETDAAAYQLAMQLAGRLIDAGVWDGETPLRIPDVYALARRLKPYRTNELQLFTLAELVEPASPSDQPSDEMATPAPTPEPVSWEISMTVTWADTTLDVEGDPLPFTVGRIVELSPDRAWVESLTADDDRWISLSALILAH